LLIKAFTPSRLSSLTGIAVSQLYQMSEGEGKSKRNVNDEQARKIERGAQLPEFWLDQFETDAETISGLKPFRIGDDWPYKDEGPNRASNLESNAEGPSQNAADGFPAKREQYAPVVGRAKGGFDGYFEEEQYPVGFSNEWVPKSVKDDSAFGLRVIGDSMAPRLEHGHYIVVSPNTTIDVGNLVYVKLRDGKRLIKKLSKRHQDAIELSSINRDHAPITVLTTDIEHIYRAFGPREADEVKHI